MKRWLLSASVLLLFGISSTQLWAQRMTTRLYPASTHVNFTVDSTLHTVHGEFILKSGELTFDPATGKASGTLVVDAASGESGNKSRDKKMTREVLETEKFPEIVFTAQALNGKLPSTGHSHIEIRGVLRLHGQEHPLTLQVDTETKDGITEATTKFQVPYVQWGMKNPSVMFLKVNDKVEISIQTHVRLAEVVAAK